MSDNPIVASYIYLQAPEVRFLEAAVEHLIPTDDLGPGARDAGVVVYIDRQLAGTWGATAVTIAPARGWRARRSRATNRASRRRKSIASRSAKSTSTARPRSAGLSRNSAGTRNCACSSSWRRTRSGCRRCHRNSSSICCGATPRRATSADPLYGGNRDMVGWKLLGFPGLPSGQYRDLLTSHEPYRAEPVSVLDVQTGKAPVDARVFRSTF